MRWVTTFLTITKYAHNTNKILSLVGMKLPLNKKHTKWLIAFGVLKKIVVVLWALYL